jgi:hypothetical protein
MIEMGFFTKASVKALRRDVAALSWDKISGDSDITSGIFIAPAGRQALADLFVVYEAASADVGEEDALEVAVDAALSEIDARYTRIGAGDPRDAQDVAERILRTFLGMVRRDRSALEHFRGAMPVDLDNDEKSIQGFYGGLARQFVIARSGDPNGNRRIEDMSTARQMFREKYDRVVANKGHEIAQWAAIDHARTMAVLCAAIYGVPDPVAVSQDAEELVRSLLADP